MKNYKLKPEYNFPISGERLVNEFLELNKLFYEDRGNTFCGKQSEHRFYLNYFITHGEYGPDYDNNDLIRLERMFNDFLSMYDEIEEEG